MYKKKIWQKIIGAAMCVCLLGSSAVSVSAQQESSYLETGAEESEISVDTLTPEVPVQTVQSDRTARYPAGGVKEADSLKLPEKAEGVEEFSGEIDKEEALMLEGREGVNAGFSSSYGYSTLNAQEKKVYNLMKSRAFAFDASAKSAVCVEQTYSRSYYAAELIDVSRYQVTLAQMERIYFALEADYPMLFWLDDTTGYYQKGFFVTSWYLMVEPDYAQAGIRRATSRSMETGMLPFLQKIDNAKAKGTDAMELELLIHDMIIEEVDYAYDIRNNPETATFAHSIVGVFDNNSSTDVVCEGYAKAFHMLAAYAGLESIYAVGWSGTGLNAGGHAWNLVKINGSWYNIDLTWNDTNDSKDYDGYSYDYFNLSTSVFNENKEHDYRSDIFPGMYSVPNATAVKEEYYNYFGLRVTQEKIATENGFISLMKNAISSNEKRRDNMLRFQCDSEATLETLEEHLQSGATCNRLYAQLNGNGIKYTKTAIMEYLNYNQLAVSISKVYVDNLCQGKVFGNPKTAAAVYDWTNRSLTNVTSSYQFHWTGSNQVTIKKGTETLGTYKYAAVTPVIANLGAVSYTGMGICPKISVTVDGLILQNQKDYIVEYRNNVNVGTGKAIIKGIGNYAGTVEKTFTIQKSDLANLSAVLSASQYAYDGKSKTPEVIIQNNGKILAQGRDYNVTYKNNKNPGQASVVVTGIGNYKNSKMLTFIIVPGKTSSLKLSKGSGKALAFTWKKQTGVSGYEVSLYKGKSKVKTAVTTKNKYQFKKLKQNTQYTFHIRAYKTINGSKKYGSLSKLTVKTASKQPSSLQITAGKKSAVLKWKKSNGVTGYEIYMSAKAKSGFKKVARVKGASKVKYTKKKLTSNKTYYFKIRSYTTKNKQTSYSGYTTVKKVKIK